MRSTAKRASSIVIRRLITAGVDEGWGSNLEVDGPNYRRGRILEAAPETFQFSITAVYMNSSEAKTFTDEEDKDVLRGDCHRHPYDEIQDRKSTRLNYSH